MVLVTLVVVVELDVDELVVEVVDVLAAVELAVVRTVELDVLTVELDVLELDELADELDVVLIVEKVTVELDRLDVLLKEVELVDDDVVELIVALLKKEID